MSFKSGFESRDVCVLYELDDGMLTFFVISFVKRIQNDVQDDVVREAKRS